MTAHPRSPRGQGHPSAPHVPRGTRQQTPSTATAPWGPPQRPRGAAGASPQPATGASASGSPFPFVPAGDLPQEGSAAAPSGQRGETPGASDARGVSRRRLLGPRREVLRQTERGSRRDPQPGPRLPSRRWRGLTCRRHARSMAPAPSRHQSSPSSDSSTWSRSRQRPMARRRTKRAPIRTSTVRDAPCPGPSARTRRWGGRRGARAPGPLPAPRPGDAPGWLRAHPQDAPCPPYTAPGCPTCPPSPPGCPNQFHRAPGCPTCPRDAPGWPTGSLPLSPRTPLYSPAWSPPPPGPPHRPIQLLMPFYGPRTPRMVPQGPRTPHIPPRHPPPHTSLCAPYPPTLHHIAPI